MKKRQLLLVEWEDIAGSGAVWDDDDKDYTGDLILCYTVGWKLKSSHKTLVLASTRTNQERCCDRTILPRVNIKSIRRLE